MWKSSRPRTKRRRSVFAVRRASGNQPRWIVGIAANVRTRKDFSAAAGCHGTRSIRPGCVRAAAINGAGPCACGVWLGRCMRTGTQATSKEEMISGKLSLITAFACLVAAIGLVHFSAHGRLVEVCGNRIRRLYFKL